MPRRPLLAAAPLLLAALAACTSGEAATPPTEAFDTAASRLLDAGTVAVDVSSDGVPQGTDGIIAVDGVGQLDAETPRFKGSVTGTISGTTGAIDVIAIGDQAWMSFFTKTYNPVDLDSMGAPNPSTLFVTDGGLAAVLDRPQSFTAGKEVRSGDEVLQSYTGTLPGALVAENLNLGSGTGDFETEIDIEPESGELRKAVLTGEFYEGATTTYTLVLSDYGTSVDIEQP